MRMVHPLLHRELHGLFPGYLAARRLGCMQLQAYLLHAQWLMQVMLQPGFTVTWPLCTVVSVLGQPAPAQAVFIVQRAQATVACARAQ